MTKEFRYKGFSPPHYTQVPDDVMDVLMPELSGAELKVLLYIIRRTYGFKKNSDAISLNQIMNGITKTDGSVLDRGTGLSESTVLSALKGLIRKEIIIATRRRSATKGDQPTIYSLHMADPVDSLPDNQGRVSESLLDNRGRGGVETADPRPLPSGTQETVEQLTGTQERDRSNNSKDISPVDREAITWTIQDIAREFNDKAPLKSSTSRAVNLYRESGLELDDFLELVQAARTSTKRNTGNITSIDEDGRKRKVPYFFEILENMIAS